MSSRTGPALVALAMVGAIVVTGPAAATPPTAPDVRPVDARVSSDNPFKGLPAGIFIVSLDSPALALYEGGIGTLQPTSTRGEIQLDITKPAAVAYRAHLESQQSRLIDRMERTLGRTVTAEHKYYNAANAIAVHLSPAEAARVVKMPGVTSVQPDVLHHLDTDAGPGWIGAPAIWDGSGAEIGTLGEGIVIGVLDTGINPENPSFADVGGDGYDHTNPFGFGNYVGVCDPADPSYQPGFACNDKLIGAWNFTLDPGPLDDVGHGSHTAGTAAGNVVAATVDGPTLSVGATISGVAPHANLIVYDVCNPGGCPGSAILAGIDQAISDGVDVINYSIGTEAATNPWIENDQLAFLAAREAGIFVAHSAGNNGPEAGSVGAPNAPWITHVAATTHPRRFTNQVGDFTGGNDSLAAIEGVGFTSGYGPAPIVYAGDYPSALTDAPELCGVGAVGDEVSPWPPGTFTNEIVVCDRGTFGRVEKGTNVLAAGAGGMVLVDDGGGLSGDAHDLPAVHIAEDDGRALEAWLAAGSDHAATIRGAVQSEDPGNADIIGGFSSRGPNSDLDIVTPSVAAPGIDIIAPHGSDGATAWDFLSGTSMASPHVAGAAALLMSLHPEWTPAEVQSALMLTASPDVRGDDGSSPTTPFDRGSGRIDVVAAANTGLVMGETIAAYLAADPAVGGDVAVLNLASMAHSGCVVVCSWTRTVTATEAAAWEVSATGANGLELSVEPGAFALAAGESQELLITADVSNAAVGRYVFGTVTLESDGGTAGSSKAGALPVAVRPSAGAIPDLVQIQTRRDAGSWPVDDLSTLEISDLTVDVTGLVAGRSIEAAIPRDSEPVSVFDDITDGTHLELVDVPEGTTRLVAELLSSSAPDLDLFAGRDADGDGTPEEAEAECVRAASTALESCWIDDPAPGTWWVLVQNWQPSRPRAVDAFTLSIATLDDADAGNMRVEGPAAAGRLEPFSVRMFWDEPAMAAGDRLYGSFALGTDPARRGNLGRIDVVLDRRGDDVHKTAEHDLAMVGDTLTYEITIEPNLHPEPVEYSIRDTIPDGLTYVPGSIRGGATLTDGVVAWDGTLPSPDFAAGSYEVTTNASDASCDGPLAGGGYVDLADFGISTDPDVVGDTVAYTAFEDGTVTFYGMKYQGLGFTDDGFAIFDVAANFGGTPWIPQTIPDPAAPNNLAAVLWQDFELIHDEASNSGVSLATAADDTLLIIEFDNIRLFAATESSLDMELVVRRAVDNSPGAWEIMMAYDNVTELVPGAIGVENAAGSEAESVPATVVGDGVIVCFDWVGETFEPIIISYDVTVDEDAAGLLENAAAVENDNPGTRPGITTASLRVVDTPVATLLASIAQLDEWAGNPPADLSPADVAHLRAARDQIGSALTPERWVNATTLDPELGRFVFADLRKAVRSLWSLTRRTSLHTDKNTLKIGLAHVAEHLANLAFDRAVAADAAPYDLRRATRKMALAEADQVVRRWNPSIKNHRRSWASSVQHLLAE